MVSFIVIGKNEGQRLTQCLTSIHTVIIEDKIPYYEIIYVDSKSTDDSLERATQFDDVRVLKITGVCNAAIGRNIGAKESKGDILFFIDGDMQILPGFLSTVINENNKLVYPFMSGIFEDYVYDENWNFLEMQRRYKLTEGMPDSYEITTGGLFMIEKKMWEQIEGMDTRLNQCEDMDLGLRLAKRGCPLLRKPIVLANHHTISYFNITRKKYYTSSAIFSALLSRKHFFNGIYTKLFIRTQYTAISLLLSTIIVLLYSPFFILIFVIPLLFRASMISKKSDLNVFEAAWALLYRDCYFLWAFFVMYPIKHRTEYQNIS